MKKVAKQLISAFMAGCLVVSAIPMHVYAEEDVVNAEDVIEQEVLFDEEYDEDEIVVSDDSINCLEEEISDGEETAEWTEVIPEELSSTDESVEDVSADDLIEDMDDSLEDDSEDIYYTVSWINPTYEDVVDVSRLSWVMAADSELTADDSEQSGTSTINCTTKDEAVEALRQAMVERQETVIISFSAASFDYETCLEEIYQGAVAETGKANEGDYLYYHVLGYSGGLSGTYANGAYELTLTYNITYQSSAEEETVVDARISELAAEFSSYSKTYDKIYAIYNYVCQHVVYDYNYANYSTYNALIDGKSVCQGYATLIYRLMRECGISCRIVGGSAINGDSIENHAWNIVYIGRSYYYLDATWDAGMHELVNSGYVEYPYLLKGSSDFDEYKENGLTWNVDGVTYTSSTTSSHDLSSARIQNSENAADAYSVSTVKYDSSIVESDITVAAITSQPVDQTAYEGDTAYFTVDAVGDDLTFEWQENTDGVWNQSFLSGYASRTLEVPAESTRNGSLYRCSIMDGYGNVVISDEAVLTVAIRLEDQLAISEEHFPDEAFRTAVATYDTDGNGYLSEYEIAEVTAVAVDSLEIRSLAGIEYFSSMQSLTCTYNQLTELDLRGCPALTFLMCNNNQLTKLDVSENTALVSLICNDNQITTMDLSNCPLLTSFVGWNNELTELKLSENPIIQSLYCENSHLTELDLSNCSNLTYLSCCDNQLTELDLSDCPALTHLFCYNNQIASLDLSGSPDMLYIECYNNALTEVNVSGFHP